MRLFSLLSAAAFSLGSPVLAGETPWQELAPDVSVRLISAGQVSADGKALLALEINMPESTKTYWRVPGDGGLPMEIDLSASRGVSGHRIFWPYPLRQEGSAGLDYAYYGHTVLPIEIGLSGGEAHLDMLATLGVCSDICIPAQVRLALPLEAGSPDTANGLRIKQAMAEVPIGWQDGPDPIGAVELMPDGQAIAISMAGDVVEPGSVIAATPTGEPLFGAPQKSPHDDLVVLPILSKSDNSALDGMDVEVTFMTDMGAYVVSRTIEAGEAGSETAQGQ